MTLSRDQAAVVRHLLRVGSASPTHIATHALGGDVGKARETVRSLRYAGLVEVSDDSVCVTPSRQTWVRSLLRTDDVQPRPTRRTRSNRR